VTASAVASEAGIHLRRGIYVMVGGPQYETPAEVRFLRSIGGDAVGMSTVPEVIVGRQLGMRVLALSVISNAAAGILHEPITHEAVLAAVEKAAKSVGTIIVGVVTRTKR
jgi:purine-nucleoside phosphorylase